MKKISMLLVLALAFAAAGCEKDAPLPHPANTKTPGSGPHEFPMPDEGDSKPS